LIDGGRRLTARAPERSDVAPSIVAPEVAATIGWTITIRKVTLASRLIEKNTSSTTKKHRLGYQRPRIAATVGGAAIAILATARARHVLIKCHAISEVRSTGDDTVSSVAVGITTVCVVVCGYCYHIQTSEPTHINAL
jgi:hypothetical protein